MDIVTDYLIAFAAGGMLCAVAQIIIDKTALTPARILVGYVVAGVFLGAVGVYGYFVDIAGAGATVPLTGFGYLIANGVREAVDEKGFFGILSGGLSAAAVGTTVVLFCSFVATIFSRSRPK